MHVAVQTGTKYEQFLKSKQKALGFTLQSYPGDTDAIAQILLGRADAVLTQDTEGAYQMQQHPGKIAIGYLFPDFDTFGIYYRKGDAVGAKMAGGDQGAEGERHDGEDRSEIPRSRGRREVGPAGACSRASTRIRSGERSPPARTGGERSSPSG